MPTERRVFDVKEVELSVVERDPPQVKIRAEGETKTPHWSDARLVGRVYVRPPADGIWEYDFDATPPSKQTTENLTPISATAIRADLPSGFRGVRIVAETNEKVVLLDRPDQLADAASGTAHESRPADVGVVHRRVLATGIEERSVQAYAGSGESDRQEIPVPDSMAYVNHSTGVTTSNPNSNDYQTDSWKRADGVTRGERDRIISVWVTCNADSQGTFGRGHWIGVKLTAQLGPRS